MLKWFCLVILVACLPCNAHADDKVVFERIKKGDTVPFGGVIMDEETAFRVAEDRVALERLIRLKTVEQPLWDFKEATYRETIKEQHEHIKRLRASWWDKNKLVVGIVVGFISGVLSVYGVYELASRQTTK